MVFHVSILKKCIGYSVYILSREGLGVDANISNEDFRVDILDRQVNKFRNKEVSSVKVPWKNHLVEGATSDVEGDMMS